MSYNIEQINGGNITLATGTLATATTTTQYKTSATITYMLNGIFGSKAATDNQAFSSGSAVVPLGKACVFAVWYDGTNFSTTQGLIVDNDSTLIPVPTFNPGKVLVGLIKIVTTSALFTPGTTVLGTGNTVTYFNAGMLPGTGV